MANQINLFLGQSGSEYIYKKTSENESDFVYMELYSENPLYSNVFVYNNQSANEDEYIILNSGASLNAVSLVYPLLSYIERGNAINTIFYQYPTPSLAPNESGIIKNLSYLLYSGAIIG